jgi:hypothetical protein
MFTYIRYFRMKIPYGKVIIFKKNMRIVDCGCRIAELKPEPSAASSAKLNPKQETRNQKPLTSNLTLTIV